MDYEWEFRIFFGIRGVRRGHHREMIQNANHFSMMGGIRPIEKITKMGWKR